MIRPTRSSSSLPQAVVVSEPSSATLVVSNRLRVGHILSKHWPCRHCSARIVAHECTFHAVQPLPKQVSSPSGSHLTAYPPPNRISDIRTEKYDRSVFSPKMRVTLPGPVWFSTWSSCHVPDGSVNGARGVAISQPLVFHVALRLSRCRESEKKNVRIMHVTECPLLSMRWLPRADLPV